THCSTCVAPPCRVGGGTFSLCSRTCRSTCSDLESTEICEEGCFPGCDCQYDSQYRDHHGTCVRKSECTCRDRFNPDSAIYKAGDVLQRSCTNCTCSNGAFVCEDEACEDKVVCPKNQVFMDLVPSCQRCEDYNNCPRSAMLQKRCGCPGGQVKKSDGTCVPANQCPCKLLKKEYPPMHKLKMACKRFVCKDQTWKQIGKDRKCEAVCKAQGDPHYFTFDKKKFNFQGKCQYTLVSFDGDASRGLPKFHISAQNVPCGSKQVTCTKFVRIIIGDERYTLVRGQEKDEFPAPFASYGVKLEHLTLYTQVVSDVLGLRILWDRKTRVLIYLRKDYRRQVSGLCGNYDGNAGNDFTFNNLPMASVDEWAEKYRTGAESCPAEDGSRNSNGWRDICEQNPGRKTWSELTCGVIKNPNGPFKDCLLALDDDTVQTFYENCIFDACGCDSGGDCECVCSAMAGFADHCSDVGVHVKWRSMDNCPLMCDGGKRYMPCMEPCPQTCRNLGDEPAPHCQNAACTEGCGCPEGTVDQNGECVPISVCPCQRNGTEYQHGQSYFDEATCRECTCGANAKFSCQVKLDKCKVKPKCEDETNFQCTNGACIPREQVCDRKFDCLDRSDEKDCTPVNTTCSVAFFQCQRDGNCIPESKRCDGKAHCSDGSDEFDCQKCTDSLYYLCPVSGECIHRRQLCDGRIDCGFNDKSDESDCKECDQGAEFRCGSTIDKPGPCVPLRKRCDGHDDCGDGSDEYNCKCICTDDDMFLCDTCKCISSVKFCDKVRDCEDGTDELCANVTTPAPQNATTTPRVYECDERQGMDDEKLISTGQISISGSIADTSVNKDKIRPTSEGLRLRSGQSVTVIILVAPEHQTNVQITDVSLPISDDEISQIAQLEISHHRAGEATFKPLATYDTSLSEGVPRRIVPAQNKPLLTQTIKVELTVAKQALSNVNFKLAIKGCFKPSSMTTKSEEITTAATEAEKITTATTTASKQTVAYCEEMDAMQSFTVLPVDDVSITKGAKNTEENTKSLRDNELRIVLEDAKTPTEFSVTVKLDTVSQKDVDVDRITVRVSNDDVSKIDSATVTFRKESSSSPQQVPPISPVKRSTLRNLLQEAEVPIKMSSVTVTLILRGKYKGDEVTLGLEVHGCFKKPEALTTSGSTGRPTPTVPSEVTTGETTPPEGTERPGPKTTPGEETTSKTKPPVGTTPASVPPAECEEMDAMQSFTVLPVDDVSITKGAKNTEENTKSLRDNELRIVLEDAKTPTEFSVTVKLDTVSQKDVDVDRITVRVSNDDVSKIDSATVTFRKESSSSPQQVPPISPVKRSTLRNLLQEAEVPIKMSSVTVTLILRGKYKGDEVTLGLEVHGCFKKPEALTTSGSTGRPTPTVPSEVTTGETTPPEGTERPGPKTTPGEETTSKTKPPVGTTPASVPPAECEEMDAMQSFTVLPVDDVSITKGAKNTEENTKSLRDNELRIVLEDAKTPTEFSVTVKLDTVSQKDVDVDRITVRVSNDDVSKIDSATVTFRKESSSSPQQVPPISPVKRSTLRNLLQEAEVPIKMSSVTVTLILRGKYKGDEVTLGLEVHGCFKKPEALTTSGSTGRPTPTVPSEVTTGETTPPEGTERPGPKTTPGEETTSKTKPPVGTTPASVPPAECEEMDAMQSFTVLPVDDVSITKGAKNTEENTKSLRDNELRIVLEDAKTPTEFSVTVKLDTVSQKDVDVDRITVRVSNDDVSKIDSATVTFRKESSSSPQQVPPISPVKRSTLRNLLQEAEVPIKMSSVTVTLILRGKYKGDEVTLGLEVHGCFKKPEALTTSGSTGRPTPTVPSEVTTGETTPPEGTERPGPKTTPGEETTSKTKPPVGTTPASVPPAECEEMDAMQSFTVLPVDDVSITKGAKNTEENTKSLRDNELRIVLEDAKTPTEFSVTVKLDTVSQKDVDVDRITVRVSNDDVSKIDSATVTFRKESSSSPQQVPPISPVKRSTLRNLLQEAEVPIKMSSVTVTLILRGKYKGDEVTLGLEVHGCFKKPEALTTSGSTGRPTPTVPSEVTTGETTPPEGTERPGPKTTPGEETTSKTKPPVGTTPASVPPAECEEMDAMQSFTVLPVDDVSITKGAKNTEENTKSLRDNELRIVLEDAKTPTEFSVTVKLDTVSQKDVDVDRITVRVSNDDVSKIDSATVTFRKESSSSPQQVPPISPVKRSTLRNLLQEAEVPIKMSSVTVTLILRGKYKGDEVTLGLEVHGCFKKPEALTTSGSTGRPTPTVPSEVTTGETTPPEGTERPGPKTTPGEETTSKTKPPVGTTPASVPPAECEEMDAMQSFTVLPVDDVSITKGAKNTEENTKSLRDNELRIVLEDAKTPTEFSVTVKLDTVSQKDVDVDRITVRVSNDDVSKIDSATVTFRKESSSSPQQVPPISPVKRSTLRNLLQEAEVPIKMSSVTVTLILRGKYKGDEVTLGLEVHGCFKKPEALTTSGSTGRPTPTEVSTLPIRALHLDDIRPGHSGIVLSDTVSVIRIDVSSDQGSRTVGKIVIEPKEFLRKISHLNLIVYSQGKERTIPFDTSDLLASKHNLLKSIGSLDVQYVEFDFRSQSPVASVTIDILYCKEKLTTATTLVNEGRTTAQPCTGKDATVCLDAQNNTVCGHFCNGIRECTYVNDEPWHCEVFKCENKDGMSDENQITDSDIQFENIRMTPENIRGLRGEGEKLVLESSTSAIIVRLDSGTNKEVTAYKMAENCADYNEGSLVLSPLLLAESSQRDSRDDTERGKQPEETPETTPSEEVTETTVQTTTKGGKPGPKPTTPGGEQPEETPETTPSEEVTETTVQTTTKGGKPGPKPTTPGGEQPEETPETTPSEEVTETTVQTTTKGGKPGPKPTTPGGEQPEETPETTPSEEVTETTRRDSETTPSEEVTETTVQTTTKGGKPGPKPTTPGGEQPEETPETTPSEEVTETTVQTTTKGGKPGPKPTTPGGEQPEETPETTPSEEVTETTVQTTTKGGKPGPKPTTPGGEQPEETPETTPSEEVTETTVQTTTKGGKPGPKPTTPGGEQPEETPETTPSEEVTETTPEETPETTPSEEVTETTVQTTTKGGKPGPKPTTPGGEQPEETPETTPSEEVTETTPETTPSEEVTETTVQTTTKGGKPGPKPTTPGGEQPEETPETTPSEEVTETTVQTTTKGGKPGPKPTTPGGEQPEETPETTPSEEVTETTVQTTTKGGKPGPKPTTPGGEQPEETPETTPSEEVTETTVQTTTKGGKPGPKPTTPGGEQPEETPETTPSEEVTETTVQTTTKGGKPGPKPTTPGGEQPEETPETTPSEEVTETTVQTTTKGGKPGPKPTTPGGEQPEETPETTPSEEVTETTPEETPETTPSEEVTETTVQTTTKGGKPGPKPTTPGGEQPEETPETTPSEEVTETTVQTTTKGGKPGPKPTTPGGEQPEETPETTPSEEVTETTVQTTTKGGKPGPKPTTPGGEQPEETPETTPSEEVTETTPEETPETTPSEEVTETTVQTTTKGGKPGPKPTTPGGEQPEETPETTPSEEVTETTPEETPETTPSEEVTETTVQTTTKGGKPGPKPTTPGGEQPEETPETTPSEEVTETTVQTTTKGGKPGPKPTTPGGEQPEETPETTPSEEVTETTVQTTTKGGKPGPKPTTPGGEQPEETPETTPSEEVTETTVQTTTKGGKPGPKPTTPGGEQPEETPETTPSEEVTETTPEETPETTPSEEVTETTVQTTTKGGKPGPKPTTPGGEQPEETPETTPSEEVTETTVQTTTKGGKPGPKPTTPGGEQPEETPETTPSEEVTETTVQTTTKGGKPGPKPTTPGGEQPEETPETTPSEEVTETTVQTTTKGGKPGPKPTTPGGEQPEETPETTPSEEVTETTVQTTTKGGKPGPKPTTPGGEQPEETPETTPSEEVTETTPEETPETTPSEEVTETTVQTTTKGGKPGPKPTTPGGEQPEETPETTPSEEVTETTVQTTTKGGKPGPKPTTPGGEQQKRLPRRHRARK
uniref:VWFD domain-containing protein n=1 Tax=Macrostomum lignano TaxID=282301 RepID=A0A1I8IQE6_9PLAT